MAKRKQTSTYEDEANLDALLKYAPSYEGLQTALDQARSTYAQGVDAARTNAASITHAVNQAIPQVQQFYATNAQDRATDQATLNQSLQNLPGANPTVLAAIAAEQARSTRLSGDTKTNYLSDLAGQKTRAAAGRVFAQQKAQQDLTTSIAQILQQKQNLDAQKGTYTALTAQQLQDAAQKQAATVAYQQAQLAQSERNSIRASGTNPDTGQPTVDAQNAAKKSGSGHKWVTANKQQQASSTVQSAITTAQHLRRAVDPKTKMPRGYTVDQIVEALTTDDPGEPSQIVYDVDKQGKRVPRIDPKTGTEVRTPAIPATKGIDPLLARAAAEQVFYGYISKKTQQRLQANGFKIGPLGVTSYGKRKPRVAPNKRIAGNSTGSGLIP